MVRFYRDEPGEGRRVKFLIASGLDYWVRLGVIVTCLVLGLVVQVLVSVWVGWVLVLAGALMGASRSIENRPRVRGRRRWVEVTLDEFHKVLETAERARRWARSVFNLVSWPGMLGLAGAAYVVTVVGAWLGPGGRFHPLGPLYLFLQVSQRGLSAAQKMWLLDAAALAVPIWLSGFRTAWRPEELLIKVRCLLEAAEYIQGSAQAEVALVPQLEVIESEPGRTRSKKRGLPKPVQPRQLPRDARLQVRFPQAPEEFLGLQVQLSINRVGRAYPYLYCVLLARRGFGLRERLGSPSRVGDEVVEFSFQQDVEVVVYRQFTTRQKGYHTNYRARLRILAGALGLVRQALAAPQPEAVAAAPAGDVGVGFSAGIGRDAGRPPGRPPRGRG